MSKVILQFLVCLFVLPSYAQNMPEKYKKELEKIKKLEKLHEERKDYIPPDVSLLMIDDRKVRHHGEKGAGVDFPKERDPLPTPPEHGKVAEQSEFRAVDYLQKLPNCEFPETKKVDIGQVTDRAKSFDYLFYSFLDPNQKEKGEKWKGLAVPYYAPKDPEKAQETFITSLQFFAIQYGVTCLPTRMHVVTEEGDKSFLLYKMGANAWIK